MQKKKITITLNHVIFFFYKKKSTTKAYISHIKLLFYCLDNS